MGRDPRESFREHVEFMDRFKNTRRNEKFSRWLVVLDSRLNKEAGEGIADVDTVLAVQAFMDGISAGDYADEITQSRQQGVG